MYYCIMHKTGRVIAEAHTFSQCSKLADETKIWDMAPGTVAPYYITSITPRGCHFCGGNGYNAFYSAKVECPSCEGTGYEITLAGGAYVER